MSEDTEDRFLVVVIRDLLSLCEIKRGKDNKAVVASNIMYIVGQYPRFLRAHWKFLKTVVNKLFEFMHENHEGVQDMACDTLIKIARKCRKQFVFLQSGDQVPFVEEIIKSMQQITSDLQPQQVHVVYEAIGCMIQSQSDKNVQLNLIDALMSPPNSAWDAVIASAAQNVSNLQNMEALKTASLLKAPLSTSKAAIKAFCFISSKMQVTFKRFQEGSDGSGEAQLLDVIGLIEKDLSEPYSIYTYRHFVHTHPDLCIMVGLEFGGGVCFRRFNKI
jgi:hypothetical protein